MKKNLPLLMLLFAASCSIRAGEYKILPGDGGLINNINSSSAKVYNAGEPRLVKSEYVEEKNFMVNETQLAKRGGSVLNNKIYRKDFYVNNSVSANKDAVLHSASVPQPVYKNKAVNVLGEVSVDGKNYRMLETEIKNFVMLIDENGKLFNKMGRLQNGRFVLLPVEYVVTPDNVVFKDVMASSTTQTKPIRGFDIKYDGVRLGRMWFTYLNYEGGKNDSGRFQEISFPAKPGLIEINNVGIRVSQVDDGKIEYVIVKYE